MSDALALKVMDMCERFGELKRDNDNNYQQVLAWSKEQIAHQQQAIARLTSRIDQLEKKHDA